MKRLISALAVLLGLFATACGNNPHPFVDVTASGNGLDRCNISMSHTPESYSGVQQAVYQVTDYSGCKELTFCASFGSRASQQTAEACGTWNDATGYQEWVYIIEPQTPPTSGKWVVIDSEVTVRADYYPITATTCLYHDVNGGNDPYICAPGVPI